MSRVMASHFSGMRVIFKKVIALVGFHRRELQISKAAHEITPGNGMGIICDVLVACLGLALPPGYRKYLGVIPDATVEILGKSYDARIPRELVRCHHMAPVGCGQCLGMFRISLP